MSGSLPETSKTSKTRSIWVLAWLGGLGFLLLLQAPTPLPDASPEHLYLEQGSRWFVVLSLTLVGMWALNQYRSDRTHLVRSPGPGRSWERDTPILLVLSFAALFCYESNWDLDIRENPWGIGVAGAVLLPLLLLPLTWHRIEGQQAFRGLLLALLGLSLLGFSQVLDYHHDHHGEGFSMLEKLAGVEGVEEALEYWALLALLQSLLPLVALKDAVVAELVKGPSWPRVMGTLAIMSVGNGLWLGSARSGWWAYLHAFGVAIAITGLVLSLRELRDFTRK